MSDFNVTIDEQVILVSLLGAQGPSAFEIARAQGYTGSIEDYPFAASGPAAAAALASAQDAAAAAGDAIAARDAAQAAALVANVPALTFSILSKINGPLLSTISQIALRWYILNSAPVNLSYGLLYVIRQGFDAGGNATLYVDPIKRTTRVRQAYPVSTSNLTPVYTTNEEATEEPLYASDAILGLPNFSTDATPPINAKWVMPDRMVVGNAIAWEISAWHVNARNGRQVACVQVQATDGTNTTPWQTVSATSISTVCEDLQPVEVYAGTIDITALTDNSLVWLRARVFPWIGTAATVLDSNGVTDARKLGTRYFTKNTTLFANPPYVYIASTGSDSTGVCSTNEATAAASPCKTVNGAIAKAHATLAANKIDGLIGKVVDTVAIGAGIATNRNQSSGAIIITRAPGSTRATAIVQQSAAQSGQFRMGAGGLLDSRLTSAAIILKDITWQRTGASQLSNGGAPSANVDLYVQVWNCILDMGNVVGLWVGKVVNFSLQRIYGAVVTNYNGNFTYSAAGIQAIFRGVNCPAATSVEQVCVISSQISAVGSTADLTQGPIIYANYFKNVPETIQSVRIVAANYGDTIYSPVVAQNLIERISATNMGSLGLSNDSAFGNVVGAVIIHNVLTGAGLVGRANLLYDEHTTLVDRRYHKMNRIEGNIFPQLNTKGDVYYAAVSSTTEAPNRLGNFELVHGVWSRGNWSFYSTQAPDREGQMFAGQGSSIGTSVGVKNDPLFVNYAGTVVDSTGMIYTAGAGGGDYHLQAGSAARGIVPVQMLGFDFAGTARGAGAQSAGLYA